MKRRDLLKLSGASLSLLSVPHFAMSATQKTTPKVIWVMLRGALDPLHTLVPTFDKDLPKLRPTLYPSISKALLPLRDGYALHPSLTHLHSWFHNKELLPVVAVSSGYNARSHFDGQDFLESGTGHIDYDSGWLGRAVHAKQTEALALARATPISLRSTDSVSTWYPTQLKDATADTYNALMKLYEGDEQLHALLQNGLDLQNKAGSDRAKNQRGKFVDLARSCAKLMVSSKTMDCAMLELGGWDTHKGQANRLKRSLKELDAGLAELKQELGQQWQNTLVIVGTEFGRTAKENGTGGTDHGTASALFFAGGAVNGGRVLGDWPGLSQDNLFEQRDLRPTSNSFSWIATAMAEHWGMNHSQLSNIFPSATPVLSERLIKAQLTTS
ncbi:DUF1501 domain-containing protein [Echinimonas agarilytica]|uniref:DUF1501 domain-containing protein n=1 Tax=Echinimonas agarilytica TaxID=1215918 RepID=A0AA42B7N0_9GAMM|nr:DUF1501 domain-containing protein [Echinimonas agarilytica]MCM2680350.1 DUF1501 domain-containing protein [Echinimonas agarilytica]